MIMSFSEFNHWKEINSLRNNCNNNNNNCNNNNNSINNNNNNNNNNISNNDDVPWTYAEYGATTLSLVLGGTSV